MPVTVRLVVEASVTDVCRLPGVDSTVSAPHSGAMAENKTDMIILSLPEYEPGMPDFYSLNAPGGQIIANNHFENLRCTRHMQYSGPESVIYSL